MGKQDGIRNAMRDVIFAAQRITERMNRCGARGCNCNAAVERRNLHAVFCIHCGWVTAGGFNVVQNQIKCLQRKGVRERI